MNKTVKIALALLLTLVLAAGGFLLGYQHMEKVPLDSPIQVNNIRISVTGVDAAECVAYVTGDMAANRLVENLMLRCTPDDLKQSMDAAVVDDGAFTVTIPMDQEGQMVYFAEELTYILQEEMGKTHENVTITVAEQETVTISFEEAHSMTTAWIAGALGLVLGILCGVIILKFEKAPAKGRYSKV